MGLNLTRKYSINFNSAKRSKKQIKKLLEEIESESIQVWLGGNNIEARCKRPLNKAKI